MYYTRLSLIPCQKKKREHQQQQQKRETINLLCRIYSTEAILRWVEQKDTHKRYQSTFQSDCERNHLAWLVLQHCGEAFKFDARNQN